MITIDDQIRDEELQYDNNRTAAKISASSKVNLVSMNILKVKQYYHLIKNK